MYYINTTTNEYPITESEIRSRFPNTSFASPFTPPESYEFVAESLRPEIPNPVIQTLKENAPVKTENTWVRSWSIVSKFTEYTDSQGILHTVDDQEAEAIAADQAARAAAIQSSVIAATQQRLDAFARTRNYDGILSLCTYATSTVPKFRDEGQCGVIIRDLTWAKLYVILAEVQGGNRSIPNSFAEIEPELPTLQWSTE